MPECPAGIGVAAGQVVAGNVGALERFEYTVIGEPVNEAARLSELAKSRPLRVLASADHGRGRRPRRAPLLETGRGRSQLRGYERAHPVGHPGAAG